MKLPTQTFSRAHPLWDILANMKVVTDEERCLEAQSLDRGISYTTSNSDAVSENKPVETFEKLLQLKQDLMVRRVSGQSMRWKGKKFISGV